MSTIPPRDSNDNPVYVYRLDDPRNEQTFYVGITVDLYQRFKQHMRCDGKNPQKDQRIQEILTSGHVPLIRTLEPTKDFEQALEREQYWIQYFQQLGMKLTNVQVQDRSIQKSCLTSSKMLKVRSPSSKLALYDGSKRRNTEAKIDQILDWYLLTGELPTYVSDRQRYSYRHHIRLPERKRFLKRNRKAMSGKVTSEAN